MSLQTVRAREADPPVRQLSHELAESPRIGQVSLENLDLTRVGTECPWTLRSEAGRDLCAVGPLGPLALAIGRRFVRDSRVFSPCIVRRVRDSRDCPLTCALRALVHQCRGSAGVNAFASHWGCGPVWINCPYRLLGRVWRKLRGDGTVATVLVPLWRSSTWWGLLAPDGVHFCEEVVDWVWLPRGEQSLFVPGSGPGGKDVVPPDWPVMAVRVDFSPGGDRRRIPLHERCVQGGCDACRSHAWHR